MKRILPTTQLLLLAGFCFIGGQASPRHAAVELQEAATAHPGQPSQPFDPHSVMRLYCVGCHSNGRAGLDLDNLTTSPTMRYDDGPSWEMALKKLRAREMPPRSRPQIPEPERQQLIVWIEQSLAVVEPPPQGPFVFRRLQRAEYVNTIRDLLDVHYEPGADFPPDQSNWVMTPKVSAIEAPILEQYRAAAASIVDEVFSRGSTVKVAMNGFDPGLLVAIKQYATGSSAKKSRAIREEIGSFARQAYRRPLFAPELDHLVKVYLRAKVSSDSALALKQVYREVLTSPYFLQRRLHTARMDPENMTALQQHNLASRLSYLLWQSMPNKDLFQKAEKKSLARNLPGQIQRMLKDPKARVFTDDFAANWLGLGVIAREPATGSLQQSMRRETEEFVAHIIREDRGIFEFLDADYSFVNDTLARHYGIEDVQGTHFRQVKLPTQRRGLLTHAGILSVSSWGSPEASPVRRGKWILDNLLGTPPPPPPSDLVRALDNARKDFPAGTFRQRFELHRADPSCAACHLKVDPLGFALENFDLTGAWRTMEYHAPVDASAVLPTGESFHGAAGLRDYLKGKRDQFVRCLTGKLLQFAKGSRLKTSDWEAVDAICENLADCEPRFSQIVLEVVRADAFLRKTPAK